MSAQSVTNLGGDECGVARNAGAPLDILLSVQIEIDAKGHARTEQKHDDRESPR